MINTMFLPRYSIEITIISADDNLSSSFHNYRIEQGGGLGIHVC